MKLDYLKEFPTIRTIQIGANEIYFRVVKNTPLEIKNENDKFDKHYKNIISPNLDLIYLAEQNKLVLHKIGNEYYTDCLINVSFNNALVTDVNGEIYSKWDKVDKGKTYKIDEIINYIYKNGFTLNGKKYLRYKRSAGAAKKGNCLFIRKDLLKMMMKWSNTGLSEEKDRLSSNLTSYEAYNALTLSSLIKQFKLNPYNILFVKDFKHVLKNQNVIKVEPDGDGGLKAESTTCDVENNIFDGEGLMDESVFRQLDLYSKGMMLLRNRYFKCCAFNTKLKDWFKYNKIKSVNELNGYTFTDNVDDIVLVVSESCLKYLKMCEGGFTKENIKRWCDAIADEQKESTFGIVKTDKKTRFFNGEMVETTYQLLNTLQFGKTDVARRFLAPYLDYITKIRDIKNNPEYVRHYLEGEINAYNHQDYVDDSEEDSFEEQLLSGLNSYSFKNKVCLDLIQINSDFVKTDLFKRHLLNNIINSFRLKIFAGRVLVHGNYATLFGNPVEYLEYIVKPKGKPLFNEKNPSSCLGNGEIYCSNFNSDAELVGSRAPHMTMGNVLYVKNKYVPEFKKWFNLTDNIVIVDAINNNIQQRLNGADYDSDSMLLTDDEEILKATKAHYNEFLVPCAYDFEDKTKKEISKDDLIDRLIKLDSFLANNSTGEIVNLSQRLNSHYWDKCDRKVKGKKYNLKELYEKIAILALLAGAEIDSAKRTFAFSTTKVLSQVRQYAKDNNYTKEPVFFYYVKGGKYQKTKRPKVSAIKRYIDTKSSSDFMNTTMDVLWSYAYDIKVEGENEETIPISKLIRKDINDGKLSGKNHDQVEHAKNSIVDLRDLMKERQISKKNEDFLIDTRDFDIAINDCYKAVYYGVNSLAKVKLLIKKFEKEYKQYLIKISRMSKKEKNEVEKIPNPYTVLYFLFYIISLKHDELGFDITDLFIYDGGVKKIEPTRSSKAKFVLFDRFGYKYTVMGKLLKSLI